jgi:guanylate kinase
MSAGPLEAMVEVRRFFGAAYDDTLFGRLLNSRGVPADALAVNPQLTSQTCGTVTAFDLTEDHDCEPALESLGSSILSDFLPMQTDSANSNTLRPLVVCGPSGVGKGTLLGKLFQLHMGRQGGCPFAPVVSHTTRSPRPGEVDGKAYNFISMDEMKAAIDAGDFVEHALVHGNYYGKSKAAVRKLQAAGKVCVMEMDVQGAAAIKATDFNARFLFIAPESMEVLENRLRSRGTETEQNIELRLQNAIGEMQFLEEHEGFFDHILVNADLDVASTELLETLNEWYPELNILSS